MVKHDILSRIRYLFYAWDNYNIAVGYERWNMITISFHGMSLLVGFFIGMLVGGCISLSVFLDKRWSLGFGEGWEANEHEHKLREQKKAEGME